MLSIKYVRVSCQLKSLLVCESVSMFPVRKIVSLSVCQYVSSKKDCKFVSLSVCVHYLLSSQHVYLATERHRCMTVSPCCHGTDVSPTVVLFVILLALMESSATVPTSSHVHLGLYRYQLTSKSRGCCS